MPVDQYAYGYDAIHELQSATRKVVSTGAVNKTFSYGYDSVWNRMSEQVDSTLTSAFYNVVNQLKSRSGGGKLLVAGHTDEPAKVTVQGSSVSEDASNNFATAIDAAPGNTTISVSATDYSPNANKTTPPKQWVAATSGGSSTNYDYDNNGNMISGNSQSYTWDEENRLTKIIIGSNTYEFAYDGLGRRISEKVNGSLSRWWVWAGQKIVEERDASGTTVTKRFYPLGEQWVGGANAGSYYYTLDQLGSIREMTNGSAAVVAQYDYDPFGRMMKLSGSLDASFLYTGHFWHKASQLALAPYRAYNPEIGRWLSRDPLQSAELLQGINLYAYVHGDPVNLKDEDGRFILPLAGAIIGGVANAIANYAKYSSGCMSGADYAKSIAFGAGVGALAGFAPGVVSAAILGGAGSFTNTIYNQALDGGGLNFGQAALSGLTGAVVGGGSGILQSAGSQILRNVGSQIGTTIGRAGTGVFKDYGNAGAIIGNIFGTAVTTSSSPPPCK
jgi:RHS repeat-associated protein